MRYAKERNGIADDASAKAGKAAASSTSFEMPDQARLTNLI